MPTDVRLANRAWESLLTAHAVLMRGFAAEPAWSEHGLAMREYDVLYTLAKCGGRSAEGGSNAAGSCAARIGELQQGVLLSQPALSRMVDRLAARGLVERVEDEADGRAVRVRLTPAGLELQRTVGRAHARSVARAVGGALEPEEQRELLRLTAKLVGADPRTAPSTERRTSAGVQTDAEDPTNAEVQTNAAVPTNAEDQTNTEDQ